MKTMKTSFASRAAFALALTACGSAPPPPPAPAPPPSAPSPAPAPAAAAPAREQAPGPLAAKASPFPPVAKRTLPNGLRVSVVESPALPVLEVRVVVHAGTGYGAPGVGEITARMLKEGGTRAHTSSEIVKRVETLGSSLVVSAGPDSTVLSMGIVRGQLEEALDVLAEVVRTPRFDPAELTRVKAQVTDQAQDSARSKGTFSANRVLFHALYPAASPYAVYGVVPAEVAKVDGAAIREFHKRFYLPANVDLIVGGDVVADGAAKAVEKVFGDWKGGAAGPTPPEFPPATPPDTTRVIVANRPKSVQSDIVVVQLLPDRHAPSWPIDRVAIQVFGGGLTGRLFQDVREKRSLAYSASARPIELAHDAQPLFTYAGTQTAKTADAVQGVMENVAGMRTSPPTEDEVAAARRFLSDIFAVRMETIGSIADMVAQLRELDLPDDYWDTYRTAIRAVATADVVAEAAKVFNPDHALIIVAGDADVVAEPLTSFGDVTVVDPEHDFRVLRTLPKSALAGTSRGGGNNGNGSNGNGNGNNK
jgi:zinc protease